MREFKWIITQQKEFLPNKAKKANEPHIVWIEAPLNVNFKNNEQRRQFNKSLYSTSQIINGVMVLKLKQIWECDNHNYFIADALCYTSEGLKRFWEAIDRTIRYADVSLFKATSHQKKMTTHSFGAEDKVTSHNIAINGATKNAHLQPGSNLLTKT